AFLRGIRNNALLGAPEIVVVKVLEPHAGDEQEVPAVLATLLDVFDGAFAVNLAILCVGVLAGAKRLVHLLDEISYAEMFRRLERIVVPHQRQRHAEHREETTPGSIIHFCQVFGEAVAIEEGRDRNSFFGLFINHYGHADATVRMATAARLTPLGGWSVNQVRPVGERRHVRDREPVARRLAQPSLALY